MLPNTPDASAPKKIYWHYALLFVVIVPWLVMRFIQPGHHDILWLCVVMERFMDGLTLRDSAYEVNPPLSMLVYYVPTLFYKVFGLSLTAGTLAQSFVFLGICATMFYACLKRLDFLTQTERHCAFFAYMIAATIGSQLAFGERDHYIALLLPPFLLLQWFITQSRTDMPRLSWPFLLFGAFLILLKPHHGLIPTIMILHRLIKRRSLGFLKDADFLSLSLMTILYAAAMLLFFRDYIDVIAPDVMKYYYPKIDWPVLLSHLTYAFMGACILMISIYEFQKKSVARSFSLLLCVCGILSLLPVLVQAKDFYYHYTPVIVFLGISGGLFLGAIFLNWKKIQPYALALATVVLAMAAYVGAPLRFNVPDYSGLERVIKEGNEGAKSPSFWVYDDMMDMGQEMRVSTGFEYGSRFATTWYLNQLYQDMKLSQFDTPEKQEAVHKEFLRFSGMIAEDLNNFKPNVVLILSHEFFIANYDINFNIAAFMSDNPVFRKAWKSYKYMGKTTYTENDYFAPLEYKTPVKIYEIYHRVPRN